MNRNLLTLLEENMKTFSKGQKCIANYIRNNYDKAAFMTAAKLGSVTGVSESTVVRFATALGYEGYNQLQRKIQDMIRNKLTSVQRIDVARDQIGETDVLAKVMNQDIEKIKMTIEEINLEEFNKSIDLIINAKTIYIIGVRSSSVLASFLGFYFNLIFLNVRLVHTTSVSEMFEQILKIDKGDVLIGISFPRYSKRTVKAMKFASDKGVDVIAITDSADSPMAKYSDNLLLARSDMTSFVDSLVAPLSLINALIVSIGIKKREDISHTFAELERIWEEYEVYEV